MSPFPLHAPARGPFLHDAQSGAIASFWSVQSELTEGEARAPEELAVVAS